MVDASTPPSGGAQLLSESQLQPIVTAAERQWAVADGSQVLATLADAKVEIADLPAGMLGETAGNTVLIDRDAAGYGWFVDPTPNNNSAFPNRLDQYTLGAQSGSPAANRVDLLTTVMHELGHVLGYADDTAGDLMNVTLPLGERRVLTGSPSAESAALDQIFASSASNNGSAWAQ